jgi:hypothetical protein
MTIRPMRETDINYLKQIHLKHYGEEFPFPNFAQNFPMTLIVENDHGKIVTGGGLKLHVESILITDKDKDSRERTRALLSALSCMSYTAAGAGHNQIHAFIQEPQWSAHLKKYGFTPAIGESLVLGV